jgi:hypothetical protein
MIHLSETIRPSRTIGTTSLMARGIQRILQRSSRLKFPKTLSHRKELPQDSLPPRPPSLRGGAHRHTGMSFSRVNGTHTTPISRGRSAPFSTTLVPSCLTVRQLSSHHPKKRTNSISPTIQIWSAQKRKSSPVSDYGIFAQGF